MSLPLPFNDQYECRNETLEVYASDRRGIVEYKFNNLGYRNNIDYDLNENNAGVYLGSSITSGIGISWQQTYVNLSSNFFGVLPYNFSQGCTKIDNTEILRQLSMLIALDFSAKYWVIQFIDFDRRFDPRTGVTVSCEDRDKNIDNFIKIFSTVESLLLGKNWTFIVCDRLSHDVPEYIRKQHVKCLSWNTKFIDFSGVGTHPGPKWHQMISLGLQKKLINSEFLSAQF
jgi:hypothetical protein